MRFWVIGLAMLTACGDEVTVKHAGDGGADPVATTTTTTTTATTTTAPPSNKPCGPGQPPCPPTEYCDMPGSACSVQGNCAARPRDCNEDCPGICGCDGQNYCNACLAHAAGVDDSGASCSAGDYSYAAAAWPGGLDHIIIMRADNTNDTCVRVYIDAPITGSYPITTPSSWGVSQVDASASASGCLDSQSAMMGAPATTNSASGSIDWQLAAGMYYPCTLDIDVALTLQAPPPGGLDTTEMLEAVAIVVDGGCF
jgi:hypothetical protein